MSKDAFGNQAVFGNRTISVGNKEIIRAPQFTVSGNEQDAEIGLRLLQPGQRLFYGCFSGFFIKQALHLYLVEQSTLLALQNGRYELGILRRVL